MLNQISDNLVNNQASYAQYDANHGKVSPDVVGMIECGNSQDDIDHAQVCDSIYYSEHQLVVNGR